LVLDLEERLRARAEAAGIRVETYIERIARDDEAAEEGLKMLAVAGLNSGESIEADEHFWAEKRRRLIDGHKKSSPR
jgi:hypothetical protein